MKQLRVWIELPYGPTQKETIELDDDEDVDRAGREALMNMYESICHG